MADIDPEHVLTPIFIERLERHMDREDEREEQACERTKRWHLGKEVPLAVIFVLITQTVGVIWWAASTNAKVDFMKEANVAAQIVQTAVDRKQDEDSQRAESRIMSKLDALEIKLDVFLIGRR